MYLKKLMGKQTSWRSKPPVMTSGVEDLNLGGSQYHMTFWSFRKRTMNWLATVGQAKVIGGKH
jgi:hypothetical protein